MGNLNRDLFVDLCNESVRIKSFEKSRLSKSIISILAISGCRFIGDYDLVECVFCGLQFKDWLKYNSHPIDVHLKGIPICPLIRGFYTSNIPLNPNKTKSIIRSDLKNIDIDDWVQITKIYGFELSELSIKKKISLQESLLFKINEHNENHIFSSLQMLLNCKYINYSLEEERLKSFNNWKYSHIQLPEKLVRAGFFYKGIRDSVTCYFCGITISNWNKNLLPMYEHMIAKVECIFVMLSVIQINEIKEVLEIRNRRRNNI